MAVKLRLTRIGRHKDPFFRVVAADSRYARDGRYIEQIGYFDPDKGIENAVINEELALKWLDLGATPSDTVKSMLSRKGILAKHAQSKVKPSAKKEKPAKAEKTEKPAAKKTTTKKTAAKKAE